MGTLVVGTGLVGSHIIRLLLARGEHPVGFDRAPSAANVADIRGKFTLIEGDILNVPLLIEVLRKHSIDSIIHTVALVGPAAEASTYEAFRVNVVGSVNVLEAARLSGIRRVVSYSSNAIFDPDLRGAPFDENAPKKPAGMNGAAKLAVEHIAGAYSVSHGMEIVSLRVGGIYGSGHSSGGVPRQLNDCAMHIIANKPYDFEKYVYVGRTDLIEARDAASAGIVTRDYSGRPRLAYNIGNGEAFSYEELANAVAELFPKATIGVRETQGRPVRVGESAMDTSTATSDLGFRPSYLFSQGFPELVQSFERQTRA
jgi:nucleoside-diphosphate-sugar epimerase